MKIFLDDERAAPEGWTRTRWPDETIELLKTGKCTHLSLDHDLGDDRRGTGYDVLLWIEEACACGSFTPPLVAIHSANSGARGKMLAACASIERFALLNASKDAPQRQTKPPAP